MLENHFLDPCEFQEKHRYWIRDNPIPTNGWFQNDLHQKWARNGLSKCQIDGTVDVGHFWFKRKYWGEATLKKERLSKWIAIFWPLYIHITLHIYSDIMYYHVNHPTIPILMNVMNHPIVVLILIHINEHLMGWSRHYTHPQKDTEQLQLITRFMGFLHISPTLIPLISIYLTIYFTNSYPIHMAFFHIFPIYPLVN